MDKKEILTAIEKVIDKLNYYAKYQEVTLDEGEKDNIKTAYLMLFPDKKFSYTSACGSCIKDAMNTLQSYYQRESATDAIAATVSEDKQKKVSTPAIKTSTVKTAKKK